MYWPKKVVSYYPHNAKSGEKEWEGKIESLLTPIPVYIEHPFFAKRVGYWSLCYVNLILSFLKTCKIKWLSNGLKSECSEFTFPTTR